MSDPAMRRRPVAATPRRAPDHSPAAAPILGAGTLTQPLGHTFRRGEGFPWWTIAGIHRGALCARSRDRETVVRAGELTLVRPGIPYDIRLDGAVAWRETWVVFAPRPEWLDLLAWPEVLPGIMRLRADGDADRQAALAEIIAELELTSRWSERSAPRAPRLAANALERALLRAADLCVAADGLHEAVRAALAAIAASPDAPLPMRELARRSGASPSHLAHLFTQQVGESPMRYHERRRLERARQLLLGTSRAIKAIADDCGFANQFHFSTRFRARFGISPRGYRRGPGPRPGVAASARRSRGTQV